MGGDRLPRGAGIDVRELEGDVADAVAPVSDAELAGARGDVLVILAAHVRDARANLCLCRPYAPWRVAIAWLAACCISVASPAPDCAPCAAFIPSPSLSFDCG